MQNFKNIANPSLTYKEQGWREQCFYQLKLIKHKWTEKHRQLLVLKIQNKQKSKCIGFCSIFISSGQRVVDCT